MFLNKFARLALTATSVAPVCITLAYLSLIQKNHIMLGVYIAIGVISVCFCIFILNYSIHHSEQTKKNIKTATPANKEVTNYFLTYLFPLLSTSGTFLDWKIAAFFYISLLIYVSFSEGYSFNPLLSFFGYKFYEAEDETGVSFVLITKTDLFSVNNDRLDVIKLTAHTYIVV
ncbi:hypothetical protein [Xenorhabdus taiwanensis]|uniref:Uncharacterized protein n=1 Tax=Xenorhabdus taiwanensis TaxID=3085177 RepID=A0ABM8K2G4_9GAMM|nr:hypothetical protein TCT1_14360 [Xenorhabdus sp. TCT-1]BET97308.1 hypothetical protein TCT1_22290 [Xenorhabdus sp. TCT-1]BET97786.1 hypothetical protein TCT1_27070 [Xenorhabdus sp. TCT-1]BET98113.1 hypothetical protein TCT1_30340 [Xenorhabdus sp. TCT-1]